MLNENHAFILDFPDLKLDIVQLNHDDIINLRYQNTQIDAEFFWRLRQ